MAGAARNPQPVLTSMMRQLSDSRWLYSGPATYDKPHRMPIALLKTPVLKNGPCDATRVPWQVSMFSY